MFPAIEAVCRAGQIVPLEPVQFEENERLVIVRVPQMAPKQLVASPTPDWQAFVGILKDSEHLNGDPLNVQEAMRRDWD